MLSGFSIYLLILSSSPNTGLASFWMRSLRLIRRNCFPPCSKHFAELVFHVHCSPPSGSLTNIQALPEFRHVIHIHDETSDQAFFVNTTLLRKNCEDVYSFGYEGGMPSKGVCWVDWISLETPPVLVSIDPPPLCRNETQALPYR